VNTLIRRPVLAVNDPGKSFRTSIMLKQESVASWGRSTALPIMTADFPTYVDISDVWTEAPLGGVWTPDASADSMHSYNRKEALHSIPS
jgi:hypothetical protein